LISIIIFLKKKNKEIELNNNSLWAGTILARYSNCEIDLCAFEGDGNYFIKRRRAGSAGNGGHTARPRR
jgi:hypothetical protein